MVIQFLLFLASYAIAAAEKVIQFLLFLAFYAIAKHLLHHIWMVAGFLLFLAVYAIGKQLLRRIQNRPLSRLATLPLIGHLHLFQNPLHRSLSWISHLPSTALYSSPAQRWQEAWPRLRAPLTLWLCVSVSLRYGYHGDSRMVIGPSSSRLIKVSSLFVDRVQVRDEDRKGVSVYGFSEKPQLSYETNWTVSNYLIVGSYNRKGFNLWLNRGSKIRMRWEAQTSHLNQLQVAMIKGELKYEMLQPSFSSAPDAAALKEPSNFKEAEYYIEEDNKYCGDLSDWNIKLSFVARVVTYIAILGFIVIVIFLILKYLGVYDVENEVYVDDTPTDIVLEVTLIAPIMPEESNGSMYGTNANEDDDDDDDDDDDEGSDDVELCLICCNEQKNCSFIPCGHCHTCYDCAQRIMEGESKVCPICRSFSHEVRRLPIP